jgi:hypothetical protein
MDTMRYAEALLGASEEVVMEVSPEKTEYTLMPRYQKAGQKRNIKVRNRSFECVPEFKYLGTKVAGQNCMHEEIKSTLNSGNACCH